MIKNLKNIGRTTILTAFVFGMVGILLYASIFVIFGSHSHCLMMGHQNMCQAQYLGVIKNTVLATADVLILGLSVSVLFLLLIKHLYKNLNSVNNYFKNIHQQFGDFKLFVYLTPLFSQGSIHPKIY
ncbi:MAG: hypothetical protein CMI53_00915 [Parcubacteria group bacterium]|nr:hypothetical protein [Parcubacteria group bacterium]